MTEIRGWYVSTDNRSAISSWGQNRVGSLITSQSRYVDTPRLSGVFGALRPGLASRVLLARRTSPLDVWATSLMLLSTLGALNRATNPQFVAPGSPRWVATSGRERPMKTGTATPSTITARRSPVPASLLGTNQPSRKYSSASGASGSTASRANKTLLLVRIKSFPS